MRAVLFPVGDSFVSVRNDPLTGGVAIMMPFDAVLCARHSGTLSLSPSFFWSIFVFFLFFFRVFPFFPHFLRTGARTAVRQMRWQFWYRSHKKIYLACISQMKSLRSLRLDKVKRIPLRVNGNRLKTLTPDWVLSGLRYIYMYNELRVTDSRGREEVESVPTRKTWVPEEHDRKPECALSPRVGNNCSRSSLRSTISGR